MTEKAQKRSDARERILEAADELLGELGYSTMSMRDVSIPTSSWVSRRAACSQFSPGSTRPPGKATSPACRDIFEERRVKRVRTSPACSQNAISTADFLKCDGNASSGNTKGW